MSDLKARLEALPRYVPKDVAKEFEHQRTSHPRPASPLVGVWREENSVLKWSDVAALLVGEEPQPQHLVKLPTEYADAANAAKGLCESEANKWEHASPSTAGHWRSVAIRLGAIYLGQDDLAVGEEPAADQLVAAHPYATRDEWFSYHRGPGHVVISKRDWCEECSCGATLYKTSDAPKVQEPAADPWQSIATAPKNYQTVLVCGEYATTRSVRAAFYSLEDECWKTEADCRKIQRVTHWMPLPAPPGAASPAQHEENKDAASRVAPSASIRATGSTAQTANGDK